MKRPLDRANLFLCLMALALVAGCGGGGSGAPTPPVPIASPTITPGVAISVVISSDRGVVLTGKNQTYEFKATVNGSSGAAVNWSSSNPAVVSVDQNGVATATGTVGSVVITAGSAGATSDHATVTVAAPASGTLLVSSSDVISSNGTQAVLASDSTTQQIRVGNVIVTDDKGGLLNAVTSVSTQNGQITIGLGPATLPDAFTDFSVDVEIPAGDYTMTQSSQGVVVRDAASRVVAVLPMSSVQCSGSAPPNFSIGNTVQFHPSARLIYNRSQFFLGMHIAGTLQVNTPTFAVSGSISGDCSISLPNIAVPIPIFGDVIQGTITGAVGVDASLTAKGTLTIGGPTITSSFDRTYGLQYAGTWSFVASGGNPTNSISMQPWSSSIAASLSGRIEPYAQAALGVQAALGLANVQVATVKLGAPFAVSINAPLSPTAVGYTGPNWTEQIELTANGPSGSVGGALGKLLALLKLPTTIPSLISYKNDWPIEQSPTIALAAGQPDSAGCVKLTATLKDTSVFPLSYDSSPVTFSTVGASSLSPIANSTMQSNVATASWAPSSQGTYSLVAEVFDPIFGKINLPYVSASATASDNVKAAACEGSPSPSGSPSSTPTPGPSIAPTASPTPLPAPSPFQTFASTIDPDIVATARDGSIWYTDVLSNTVQGMSTAPLTLGQTLATVQLPATLIPDLYGITGGADGNVWVAEYDDGKIARISTSGGITEFPAASPSYASAPVAALDITSGSDGDLWYILEGSSNIVRMSTAGTTVAEYTIPNLAQAESLGVGPDGNMWFTDLVPELNNGSASVAVSFGEINAAGQVVQYPVTLPPLSAAPYIGQTMVSGSDGYLYVALAEQTQIARISTTGTVTYIAGLHGQPIGMAATSGVVWSTFIDDFELLALGVNTQGVSYVDDPCGSLPNALSVTVGGDGALWLTDIGDMFRYDPAVPVPTTCDAQATRSATARPKGSVRRTEALSVRRQRLREAVNRYWRHMHVNAAI